MLDKQTIEVIKKSIKEINKNKNVEERLQKLISLKEEIRNEFNEEVDELLSEVDLKVKRFLTEDDFLSKID